MPTKKYTLSTILSCLCKLFTAAPNNQMTTFTDIENLMLCDRRHAWLLIQSRLTALLTSLIARR